MATATSIIQKAMRKLALLASGETATATELSDALECLNDLLDSWSVEQIIIPYTQAESFSLVNGQSSYTIGSAGDFDTTRPISIIKAFIRDSNNVDHLLDVQNYTQYLNLANKFISNRPRILYYKATYPLGIIYFDTKPAEVETLYIESIKHLTSFPDLTTDLDIVPELKSALVYNLAIELAPEFGVQPTDTINVRAIKTFTNLKSASLAQTIAPVVLDISNRNSYYNIDSDI